MQIPILNGTLTSEGPDFRTSYPRNMVPVPKLVLLQGMQRHHLQMYNVMKMYHYLILKFSVQ